MSLTMYRTWTFGGVAEQLVLQINPNRIVRDDLAAVRIEAAKIAAIGVLHFQLNVSQLK